MKSGIIPVKKPEGISSAAVVARVKKVLGAKKVGHTGTLDPFATGLLLCAVNQGTRISRFFLGGTKKYRAQIHLGIETDTYDRTGMPEKIADKQQLSTLDESDIYDVIQSFQGVQDQVPPIFSALKHEGQPLYKLARKGEKIQKPPRQIEIFSLDLLSVQMPYLEVDVHCSAGTYIRSLAFDIGRKLGCGANLSALCRTGSSQFTLDDAIDLETLEALDKLQAEDRTISLSKCLAFMPGIEVGGSVAEDVRHGRPLSVDDIQSPRPAETRSIRLLDCEGSLLAVVSLDETLKKYKYSCVFAN